MRNWIFFIIFIIPLGAHASVLDCEKILGGLGEFTSLGNSSTKNTAAYLNLIKYLVKEKNFISSMAIEKMIAENNPPNPMKYVAVSVSTENKYSFSKAFESLKEIDWELAKNELRKLADETKGAENKRHGAEEDTKYIFWPTPVQDDVLSSGELKDLTVSLPLDLENQTAFVGRRGDLGYFVDLEKQKAQAIPNMLNAGDSLLRTRNNHFIIGYYTNNGNLLIKDLESGSDIETLNIAHLFPNNRISRQHSPRIFENETGGFHITLSEDDKSNIFDTTQRQPTVVDRDKKSDLKVISITQGRIFAKRNGLYSHVNIVQMIGARNNILLDVELPKSILSQDTNQQDDTISSTPSGRIFLTASRSNGFAVYELGDPDPKIVYVEPQSLFQLSQKKIIELPNGEIKVLAHRRSSPETEYDLELIGMDGPLERILIPPADKKVSISYGRFPSFFTYLNLRNGRTLFAGLAEIRDGGRAPAEKLYVFDDSRNVQTLDISQFEVTSLQGLQERDDGRIIGYFTNNFIVKALELYRPIHEVKEER